MSQSQVHTSPNVGEICSNTYEDTVFMQFSWPAMILTFDFLTPKSNQHIYECKYTCDQN